MMAGGGVASEFDPIHMTQFTYEEMKAAVDVAADYGTYVLVHAYHDRAVNRAIDAGVRCIEHNFLVSEETIKRMKKEGVALSIQSVMSLEAFHPDNVAKITFFSPEQKAKAVMVNSGASQMLKWALKHDLIMVTGGDMFDAANVNRQIENLIQLKPVGFSNVQILRTATSTAGSLVTSNIEGQPNLQIAPPAAFGGPGDIHSPEDLRRLSRDELPQVADEVRAEIERRTGGRSAAARMASTMSQSAMGSSWLIK